MKNPLILYVITDLELGGVPLHLLRVASAMRERGFRVAVVPLTTPGPVGAMAGERGIGVFACEGRGGWDFRVIERLSGIIDGQNPSLIHSFLFHGNLAARFAALLSGFPRERLICEIQTVEVERRWHLWVDWLTHRLCRLTLGNSPSVIEHLHRCAGIARDRLRLVRGGIDVQAVRDAPPADRAALGLSPTDKIVLWVGRFDPVKGLDILIRAFETPAGKTPAQLLLVGDGPLRRPMENLAAALGLAGRVHFPGPRRDVPSLLKIADVFTFPSRTEGLPNALLEAMAAGQAIVTTDVPGCRDLVRHGETGLLVPYGDTQSLGDALLTLLTNPERARRLGQAAARSAASNWPIAHTLDAYESFYREARNPTLWE